MPKPEYPKAGTFVKVSGKVNVQILIDEKGNVIEAKAVSGHPLLKPTSEKAALQAKFEPFLLSGNPVKVRGVIVYNFLPNALIQPKQIEETQQPEIPKGKPIVDISRGIVVGIATKLPKPARIFCNCRFGNVSNITSVAVQIDIDEQGNVTKATAVSGHPILKMASEKAARQSKFTPTMNSGIGVRAKTVITYKFLIKGKSSVKLKEIDIKEIEISNQ